MNKIFQILLLIFLTGHVVAQNKTQWVAIGEGTYNHGFIYPYKIKLYVPKGFRDIEELKLGLIPLKFKLKWLPIKLSGNDIQKMFREQLKEYFSTKEGFDLSKNIISRFLKKLPAIKKYDEWVFTYYPDVGSKLYIHDKQIHHLVGAEFNRALIQSWLNKSPVLTSNLLNRLLKVQ